MAAHEWRTGECERLVRINENQHCLNDKTSKDYKDKTKMFCQIFLIRHHPTKSYYDTTLCTLSPWSEVLFKLGEVYPRQSGQTRGDCLGEDLGEGKV